MDKETLSNYGWIVICVLVLAVMIALATPFGTFVADGFKATYTGLFDTGDSALDVGLSAVGVTNTLECGHGRKASGDHSQLGCGHFACEDCGCVPASCGTEGHWSGDGKDHTRNRHYYSNGVYHNYNCECNGWIMPKGGTFVTKNAINGKTTFTEGEQLPCNYSLRDYDTYTYGDYKYTISVGGSSDNGWVMSVIDKTKTEYEPIPDSIYGRDISVMSGTFRDCTNMIIAPELPKNVERLEYAFSGCTSLTTAPTIPVGIKSLSKTFYNCTSLTDISKIEIPSTVTDMSETFYGCTSLKDASNTTIPSSVTNMQGTFYGCTSLENAPNIPINVTTISDAFNRCSSLSIAPNLSHCVSLTKMHSAFMYCTSLTVAPTIPSNVTDVGRAFFGCTLLTGTIEINANPTSYTSCFASVDMSKLTLTGSCDATLKQKLANTGKNGSQVTIIE